MNREKVTREKMNRNRLIHSRRFRIIYALMLIGSFAFAQQAKVDSSNISSEKFKLLIISSDTVKNYSLPPFIQFFADTANQFTIEQISSPEFSNRFTSLPVDALGKVKENDTTLEKIKSKTYWMRFTIKSNFNYDKEWMLSINVVTVVSLVCYIPDGAGKFNVKKAGNIPLKEKDFKHGGTQVNCLVRGQQEQTFYIKYFNDHYVSLWATVELINKDKVLENIISSRLIYGVFFGIFLLMILYNTILFISIRERSYLYYVLYIFFFSSFIFIQSGFGFEFLWQNHPEWNGNVVLVIGFLFLFFYVLFGKTYLNTKKHLPKWNKAILIQIIGLCAVAVMFPLIFLLNNLIPTWVIGVIATIMSVFLLSSFVILLIPAILCIRKGISHARYFLMGNIMVALGVSLALVAVFSKIESISFLKGYAVLTGVVLEIIIFSIGIGAKVNGLTKDKVKAQGETIVQLEENEKLKDKVNRELEEKVQERTAEVVQQKNELQKQKYIIEEKNKDITDSITYALRIQGSFLAPMSEIATALPNSFVLFKPKDIVSGDFYWFEKKEDKIFIAACDCTGHGVPGAIMSMLGADKLNEALVHTSDVSKILNSVNRGVKKALRQSENDGSTRDGMDIALCAFEKDFQSLEYSGANRPLLIVRNNAITVEETKATKSAIGGLTIDEQVFAKHTIQLSKGDTVYIASDGFADQFSPQCKEDNQGIKLCSFLDLNIAMIF